MNKSTIRECCPVHSEKCRALAFFTCKEREISRQQQNWSLTFGKSWAAAKHAHRQAGSTPSPGSSGKA